MNNGHLKEHELASDYLDAPLSAGEEAKLSQLLEHKSQANQAGFGDVVDVAASLIAAGAVDTPAPPGSLDRLMNAVDQLDPAVDRDAPPDESNGPTALPPIAKGFGYLSQSDAVWVELPQPGLRIRTLSDHPEDPFTIIVLEMDPRAVFPYHHHKGVETGYILSGDLDMDGRIFVKGDFMRAEASSDHPEFISPSGCQALLVMARENFPRKKMKVLSLANRLLKRGNN